MIKKLYNGTIFKLSSYDKNFLSRIRNDFSEGVLVYDILKATLSGNGTVKITGNEFKLAGLDREPDYYFRMGSDTILFESKDFFMKGSAKLSYDFNVIEGELKKEGRLSKAVKQLATNIHRCMTLNLPLDNDYDPKQIRIYPIIVVHDSLYSAPGFNFWIQYWLLDELRRLIYEEHHEDIDLTRIVPLTILEIDTLILYQRQFEIGYFDLLSMLQHFHYYVGYSRVGHVPPEEMEKYAEKSALSFSEFMRETAHRNNVQIDFRVITQLLSQYGIQ